MEMVRHGRIDLSPLITHRFALDQIEDAYDLFGHQRDGVVKVGLTPWVDRSSVLRRKQTNRFRGCPPIWNAVKM